MGNQLVIPSMGSWFEEPIKKLKLKIRQPIDSGTFFLTFDCIDSDMNRVIVKAYEYSEPLVNSHVIYNCERYFKHFESNTGALQGIIPYHGFLLYDRYAFLVRKKQEFTLSERITEYPLLEDIEKLWVVFQILKCIVTLHSIDLCHGSLNPDNVFVNWDTRVSIGDMAPFKPTQIREDRSNVFYHFFGSASRNHCYLSPEQLIFAESSETHSFGHHSFGADLFSVGCIIYYIYTSSHLFTFSDLRNYSKNKFPLNEKMVALPKFLHPLVTSLLNIDPNERQNAFKSFQSTFPLCFSQIYRQFHEFFGGAALHHLVQMIPVFKTLIENEDVSVRIVFANIFSQFLLMDDDIHSIITFTNFLIEFVEPLPDEILLCRILPNIIGLFSSSSLLIKATALRSLCSLLSHVKSSFDHIQPIISKFMIPSISKLSINASVQIRCVIAESLPALVVETYRLSPCLIPQLVPISNFLINENDNAVISSFVHSLKNSSLVGYHVFDAFLPILLSSLNNGKVFYKEKLLDLFISVFSNQCSLSQKSIKHVIIDLTQAVIGFLHHESSFEMIFSYLKYLLWFTDSPMKDDCIESEIFEVVMKFVDSPYIHHSYLSRSIIKALHEHYSSSFLPSFVLKQINASPQTPNLNEPSSTELNRIGCNSPIFLRKPHTYNPKFIHSSRVDSSPVVSIVPFPNNQILFLDNGKIMKFQNLGTSFIESLSNRVKSVKEMPGNDRFIMQTEENILIICDFTQPNKLNQVISSNVASYCPMSENTYSYINQDGQYYHHDLRMKSKIRSMKFESLTPTSMCSWESGLFSGFGFKEGIVQAVDTRINLPFSMFVAFPIKQVLPFNQNKVSAFISSSRQISTIDLENHVPITCYSCQTIISESFKGGIVSLNKDGVYITYPNTFSILIDRNSPIPYTEKDIVLKDKNYAPLHMHSSSVTALRNYGNTFYSADCLGFLHIWSI